MNSTNSYESYHKRPHITGPRPKIKGRYEEGNIVVKVCESTAEWLSARSG